MDDKVQIASLELRTKLAWRISLPVAAALAVGGFVWLRDVWSAVLGVGLTAWAAIAWRERVIVVGDVVYHRHWCWHRPLLLDHLAEATVESATWSHGELVLMDRNGVGDRLTPLWYDNWRPLAAAAARAVSTGAARSDPKGRKRLLRNLQQLEYAQPSAEEEAAGDGDRLAGDERGA